MKGYFMYCYPMPSSKSIQIILGVFYKNISVNNNYIIFRTDSNFKKVKAFIKNRTVFKDKNWFLTEIKNNQYSKLNSIDQLSVDTILISNAFIKQLDSLISTIDSLLVNAFSNSF